MHHGGLDGFSKTKIPWEDLMADFNSIKRDISIIKNMNVFEENKKPILEELQKQLGEVKEKMHDYIDTL